MLLLHLHLLLFELEVVRVLDEHFLVIESLKLFYSLLEVHLHLLDVLSVFVLLSCLFVNENLVSFFETHLLLLI